MLMAIVKGGWPNTLPLFNKRDSFLEIKMIRWINEVYKKEDARVTVSLSLNVNPLVLHVQIQI